MNTSVKVLITIQFAPELIEKIEAVSQRIVVTTSEVRKLEEIPEEIWENIENPFYA